MRIAMWSGPRNLSTAMMYSFGARGDFRVMDEPFYGPYLVATGLDHPMRDRILDVHETDPNRIDLACQAQGAPHLYMKHMAHHMIPGFPMGWAEGCTHVHLIRHPARVIASYAAKREAPTLDDIGFVQQVQVFERFGGLVIDSTEIRAAPETMLRRLCAALGLEFVASMLHWPMGPRAEDGIWAEHWYHAVHKSTGFAGPEGPMPVLDPAFDSLLDQAMPHYLKMREHCLG